MTTLTPYIVCRNASEAIDFYAKAFNGTVVSKTPGPDGRIINAMVDVDGAKFMLMDEMLDMGSTSPQTLGGCPLMLALEVPDCDAFYNHAVEAGCTAGMPPADMFWGQRWGTVTCPYGFTWSISSHQRVVSAEEIQAALNDPANQAGCA